MKYSFEVTIGIPVYRSIGYVMDTMISVLNQTYRDIEFLIVDDCGNDGSIDLIRNLQHNHSRGKDINILNNDSNRGVGYCRNRIIDEAKGRFLYFMDSDDTIEPNTIQLLYDAIIQNHVQIAYGSYEIIDGIGNSPIEKYQKDSLVLKGEDELAMYVFKNNNIFHVSVCNHLVDLSFLRQSGVRFIDASYWEDMVYTTELVTKIGSAVLLPDITYHYYRHSDSLSNYQVRNTYEKEEVKKNISVIQLLKEKCVTFLGKNYLPYLCYNLEVSSFYIVCHIYRNANKIYPRFTFLEMRDILRHPLIISKIMEFKNLKVTNLCLWFLANLPIPLFIAIIWLVGKNKKAI